MLTQISPGKLLRALFPRMPEPTVKRLAEAQIAATQRQSAQVGTAEEDFLHAIMRGPSDSCMHGDFYRGHAHPAIAYASGDIEVIWLDDDNGHCIARTLANKTTKKHTRIYGAAHLLSPQLERMGYAQERYALHGCRLRRIADDNRKDAWLMPYVDAGVGPGGGSLYARIDPEDSDYFRLNSNRREEHFDTHCGYENKGLVFGGNGDGHDDDDNYENYDEEYDEEEEE